MQSSNNDVMTVVRWFVPTVTQVAAYVFITFFTAVLSSQEVINQLLFSQEGFNPIRAAIGYIDVLLQNIVGERLAGGLSLGLFWGLVGLIVNLVWWIGSSFSTELSNDLVFSKYVHPKDADQQAPIKEFIIRSLIRAFAGIAGLLYFNYVLSNGLPRITQQYSDIFATWSSSQQWQSLIGTVVLECLMLHGVVVLTRVMLLRKPSSS